MKAGSKEKVFLFLLKMFNRSDMNGHNFLIHQMSVCLLADHGLLILIISFHIPHTAAWVFLTHHLRC